jgi:hypothetical protein
VTANQRGSIGRLCGDRGGGAEEKDEG